MFACVRLPKEISGRQMIPMSGIAAGGNSGEINTSVFGKAEAEEMEDWASHKMSLASPSLMQSVFQSLTLQPCPEQHQSGPR